MPNTKSAVLGAPTQQEVVGADRKITWTWLQFIEQLALMSRTDGTVLYNGTAHQVLHGDTIAPTWGPVILMSEVSGVLPVENGGTNSNTALSGSSIMVSDGIHVVQGLKGTTTTVLHGNAAGSPTYSAVDLVGDVTGTLGVSHGGTGTSTAFTATAVVYAGASGVYAQDSTNFSYDSTGKTLTVTNLKTGGGAVFQTTTSALTNGAGASAGTITNAPAVGNPTKWIGINDNGTTRYIPAW